MGNRFTEWVCGHAGRVVSGDSEAFVAIFGEVEILTVSPPARRSWRVEVCFPRPHSELQRRQMYLVGIRLTPSPQEAHAVDLAEAAFPGDKGALLTMRL
mmetsp:Transcript_12686/g.34754  ORF Transcript_12686/g.34754 Transcript_12686/m.34754 type:complete len:99 (-) Transcript_12686:478-774(-)